MVIEGCIRLQLLNKGKDILFEDRMTQEEYAKRYWAYVFTRPTLKERLLGRREV